MADGSIIATIISCHEATNSSTLSPMPANLSEQIPERAIGTAVCADAYADTPSC